MVDSIRLRVMHSRSRWVVRRKWRGKAPGSVTVSFHDGWVGGDVITHDPLWTA